MTTINDSRFRLVTFQRCEKVWCCRPSCFIQLLFHLASIPKFSTIFYLSCSGLSLIYLSQDSSLIISLEDFGYGIYFSFTDHCLVNLYFSCTKMVPKLSFFCNLSHNRPCFSLSFAAPFHYNGEILQHHIIHNHEVDCSSMHRRMPCYGYFARN